MKDVIIVTKENWEDIEEGHGEWEMVVEGDWISHGKWEYKSNVVLHKPSGKHYQYEYSRSGSYYSEYYFSTDDEYPDLTEVVQKERVVTEKYWESV